MQELSWEDKDRLVLRAGYNYSNNPVPNETLAPLWPLINDTTFLGNRIPVHRKMGLRLHWTIRFEEQCDLHQSLAAIRAKRDRIHQRLFNFQYT